MQNRDDVEPKAGEAAQRMLALALRIVGLAVGVRSPSVIAHYICAVVRVP